LHPCTHFAFISKVDKIDKVDRSALSMLYSS
jgi:hypothetical protein